VSDLFHPSCPYGPPVSYVLTFIPLMPCDSRSFFFSTFLLQPLLPSPFTVSTLSSSLTAIWIRLSRGPPLGFHGSTLAPFVEPFFSVKGRFCFLPGPNCLKPQASLFSTSLFSDPVDLLTFFLPVFSSRSTVNKIFGACSRPQTKVRCSPSTSNEMLKVKIQSASGMSRLPLPL